METFAETLKRATDEGHAAAARGQQVREDAVARSTRLREEAVARARGLMDALGLPAPR